MALNCNDLVCDRPKGIPQGCCKVYGGYKFIIDPYLAPKHSQEPLIGKSRNPLVDLPCPAEEVVANVEMVVVSHLHPDHFDNFAQQLLPKNIELYCQPSDEHQIRKMGFSKVTAVEESVRWHGITITRAPGQHGSGIWTEKMGAVAGYILRADNEPTIYWAGDTIWYEVIEKVILETLPDIIITHSSGASFEQGQPIIMDSRQTIEVCRTAPQSKVIATHMETFDFDTVSRQELRAAAEAAGIQAEQLLIPADGEVILF